MLNCNTNYKVSDMNNNFQTPLSGIIPPMVTPLTSNSSLDLKGLNSLIEHLIKGGVHGIFILGTTGESASLSMTLRENLIEQTLKIVNKRVPVLVGITDCSEEVSLRLARKAKDAGAKALVSAPPFYYSLGQQELIYYYEKLAEKLPLPIFLYNMPSHTKIFFDVKTVLELSKHPNIIGLKDSSANTQYFQSLLYSFQKNQNFALLVGPEEILAETVLLGGNGGVNGGANIFPELYVELYNACVERDFSRIVPLQNLVMEISSKIYTVGNNQSSYLKGLKTALSFLEICDDYIASPLTSFNEKDKNTVFQRVKEIQSSFSNVKLNK